MIEEDFFSIDDILIHYNLFGDSVTNILPIISAKLLIYSQVYDVSIGTKI